MKQVALGMTAGLALVFAVPAASAGATPCSVHVTKVGNVKATGTTCAIATKVIHAELQGKTYGGFKCTSTPNPSGATIVCKKGKASVRFQTAD